MTPYASIEFSYYDDVFLPDHVLDADCPFIPYGNGTWRLEPSLPKYGDKVPVSVTFRVYALTHAQIAHYAGIALSIKQNGASFTTNCRFSVTIENVLENAALVNSFRYFLPVFVAGSGKVIDGYIKRNDIDFDDVGIFSPIVNLGDRFIVDFPSFKDLYYFQAVLASIPFVYASHDMFDHGGDSLPLLTFEQDNIAEIAKRTNELFALFDNEYMREDKGTYDDLKQLFASGILEACKRHEIKLPKDDKALFEEYAAMDFSLPESE